MSVSDCVEWLESCPSKAALLAVFGTIRVLAKKRGKDPPERLHNEEPNLDSGVDRHLIEARDRLAVAFHGHDGPWHRYVEPEPGNLRIA